MAEQGGAAPVLEVKGLAAGHHGGLVLKGIDLAVQPGEVVGVLGRNGVGKSTFMYAIVGLLPVASGSVRVDGIDTTNASPHSIARLGVGLVPQGRRIWTGLTVDEHLRIASRRKHPDGRWTIDTVVDLLPRLGERRANRADTLSGGEQQMLAIARALLANPHLLLMDEPSEGLAPRVIESIGEITKELAASGLTVLLVEQNLTLVGMAASRVVILDKGAVAHQNTVEGFRGEMHVADRLLGIGIE